MQMRDSTSSPSLQIQGMIACGAPSKSAAPKCRCNSRSDSTQRLRDSVGLLRFGDEHLKCRNIGVPFDQRRPDPEPLQGGPVEVPYGFGHVRAVAIYPYRVLPDAIDHMTGQVKLLYGAHRYRFKVG